MKVSIKILIALFSVMTLLSCKSSDNDSVDQNNYQACNKWIASTMRSHYLWYSEIPADSKLNFSSSPETFFYTLLSSKDGKGSGSNHYYYSYIESNKDYKASTKAINDDNDSYGMDFVRYSVSDGKGQTMSYEYDRIVYILPGSPAEKAGLERGDFITKIDGSDITISSAVYKKLMNGASRTLTVYRQPMTSESKPLTITLGTSSAVNNDPIFLSSVNTIGSKKIGYLVYNQFSTGLHDEYTDHTYDKELIALFNDKFKDVNEFVLDLRYNPGGYLTCARLLSRLLVPANKKSSVFCKLTDNKSKAYSYSFSDIDGDNTFNLNGFTSLNLSHLYIIATESTASAAEAVINGMKPVMSITHIGYTTEGKNVGSDNYDGDDKYAWDIQPITFSITSSAGNDYSTGLVPDYSMNELNQAENPTLLALGDTSEYLFAKAIELITGSSSLSVMQQKTNSLPYKLTPIGNSFSLHKVKGLMESFNH
jgi:carboxyl-terminal processing protease